MLSRTELAEIVSVANRNLRLVDGTTKPVQEIISRFDLVFGVWQDFREPYGVGISVVKGIRRLKAVAESGKPRFVAEQQLPILLPTSWSAIKCENAEHAEAARLVLGDSSIMEAFVYVVKSEDGLIKIGRSGDPKTRRQNLQTGSPFPLALFHIEPCPPALARKAELFAQRMLSEHKLNGEWFNCTAEQAIEVVRRAVEAIRNGQPSKSYAPSSFRGRRP